MYKIAVVGRPNVGKSTLFNRLIGKKKALVSNISGITQDRKKSFASLIDLQFELIDTAGINEINKKKSENDFFFQTKTAILETDLVLFVIDCSTGLLPSDFILAKFLKKTNKRTVLIANKCDVNSTNTSIDYGFNLGFGEPLLVSAEHNLGFINLHEKIYNFVKEKTKHPISKLYQNKSNHCSDLDEVKVSFVGKPNTGKSTLINNILGYPRLITDVKAGSTRDSIEITFRKGNQKLLFIDTAGIRRKSSISNTIEQISIKQSFREIRRADISILIIDSLDSIQKQDLLIANKVLESGNALIIALNKWDCVKEKLKVKKNISDKLKNSLSQLKDVKVLTISALTGEGVTKLIEEIIIIKELFTNRIATSKLNTWLSSIVNRNPPPLVKGRTNSLRYITQIKSKPPTFVLFCSYPKKIPKSYVRYIENAMRSMFNFSSLPIKYTLKRGENPYMKN